MKGAAGSPGTPEPLAKIEGIGQSPCRYSTAAAAAAVPWIHGGIVTSISPAAFALKHKQIPVITTVALNQQNTALVQKTNRLRFALCFGSPERSGIDPADRQPCLRIGLDGGIEETNVPFSQLHRDVELQGDHARLAVAVTRRQGGTLECWVLERDIIAIGKRPCSPRQALANWPLDCNAYPRQAC